MPADGPFEFTRAQFREVLSRVRPIAYYELPKSLGPAFRRGAPLIRVAADGRMSAAICDSPLSGVYLAIVPTSVHVDRLGVSIHMEAGELINVGAVEPIWVKDEPRRRARSAAAQPSAAGVD